MSVTLELHRYRIILCIVDDDRYLNDLCLNVTGSGFKSLTGELTLTLYHGQYVEIEDGTTVTLYAQSLDSSLQDYVVMDIEEDASLQLSYVALHYR